MIGDVPDIFGLAQRSRPSLQSHIEFKINSGTLISLVVVAFASVPVGAATVVGTALTFDAAMARAVR
jgi:hypothetical protein